ncbi:MAG TPA: hypothetical protein VLU96_10925 [Gaiellaceae bacterium]|nr:hypothetical protein [Gaiellaceae bacterium]
MHTPPPPTQHCSIALWRGYVTAQFYVQTDEIDDAVRVSQSFRTLRFPWQERKTLEDDPTARAALDGLEGHLLARGWKRTEPQPDDEWYELHFQRGDPAEPPVAEPRPIPRLAGVPRQRISTNGARAAVTVETFVTGYRAALGRYTAAVDRCDPPEDTYLPLFETLNWAARLVDSLGHPEIATAQGLRWARNAVHLHWAKALEPRGVLAPQPVPAGERHEIIQHTVALDWFWLPVERIPKPRTSKQEPELREAYVTCFAGQRAQEPLRRLLDELAPHLPATTGTTLR